MKKRNSRSHDKNLNEAFDTSLDLQQWQTEHIKAAIKQADAGRLIEHEEVKKMVERWQQRWDTQT